jgi:hypothetical protein
LRKIETTGVSKQPRAALIFGEPFIFAEFNAPMSQQLTAVRKSVNNPTTYTFCSSPLAEQPKYLVHLRMCLNVFKNHGNQSAKTSGTFQTEWRRATGHFLFLSTPV